MITRSTIPSILAAMSSGLASTRSLNAAMTSRWRLQPDVPDLLATAGAAGGCGCGRRDGDQGAVGRIAGPSLGAFDPFQQ